MTGIVLDASITLSWCFPDEQKPLSLDVLERLRGGEQELVPSFWPVEVLNVLLVGERKGRIAARRPSSSCKPCVPCDRSSTMLLCCVLPMPCNPSAAPPG